jgi:hypothetical protein
MIEGTHCFVFAQVPNCGLQFELTLGFCTKGFPAIKTRTRLTSEVTGTEQACVLVTVFGLNYTITHSVCNSLHSAWIGL